MGENVVRRIFCFSFSINLKSKMLNWERRHFHLLIIGDCIVFFGVEIHLFERCHEGENKKMIFAPFQKSP